jgi:hypothetical protein
MKTPRDGLECSTRQAIFGGQESCIPMKSTIISRFARGSTTTFDRPTRFTAAKRPYYGRKQRGLSWFRDSAHFHLAKIREMVAILENHNVAV